MSHIGAAAVEWLRRRWLGLRGIANGLFAVASPPNGGDAMIGRETRVLLRHYLEQGLSKAAMARLASVSRRTVRRWIAAGHLDRDLDEERVRYGPRRPRPSRLDPYKEIIETRLAGYPDLSAVRLFEEIREAGYRGGYDQVRRHVREIRPHPQPAPAPVATLPSQGPVRSVLFSMPGSVPFSLPIDSSGLLASDVGPVLRAADDGGGDGGPGVGVPVLRGRPLKLLFKRLGFRKNNQIAAVAMARELAGFVWALKQESVAEIEAGGHAA